MKFVKMFREEKIAVNCKDEKEALEFLRWLVSVDIKMFNSVITNVERSIQSYGEKTCYAYNYTDAFGYGSKSFYEGNDIKIISFDDFKFHLSNDKNYFDNDDLQLFDIIEHSNGEKQMVVSLEEELELSSLDGGGNQFYKDTLTYCWCDGAIIKVWRPNGRGDFGSFLKYGFREQDFTLVYKVKTGKEKELEELELLAEHMSLELEQTKNKILKAQEGIKNENN